jgi:two-component sensor histidine kinase
VLPLLAVVILVLFAALVAGYSLITRAARAEAEAAQAAALAEARDRADLLAREINHRVKNLFAVILAIVRMGAKEAPEARPASERMAERIGALLTAHEVTQGAIDQRRAALRDLVETTLAPYRSERLTATVEGPHVMLAARRASPLGLVLHELTTNAVKYGCWRESGDLSVVWSRVDNQIELVWRERCAVPGEAAESNGGGFGTRLIEASARQLRGSIERRFLDDGAEVVIRFPAED